MLFQNASSFNTVYALFFFSRFQFSKKMVKALYDTLFFVFIMHRWYSTAVSIDSKVKTTIANQHQPKSLLEHEDHGIPHSAPEIQKSGRRVRRQNRGDNIDMKSLLSIINNDKTMIDDHRIMLNNSINVNAIQIAVSEHHTKVDPIWTSWRHIALVFVLLFVLI